jgi:hypothetical protein
VGIVAHNAFCHGVVLGRVDAGDFLTGAPLVREIGVAANAEGAAAVNVEPHGIPGMIIIGTVAVFTADGTMGRVLDVIILILMTFPADRGGLVF